MRKFARGHRLQLSALFAQCIRRALVPVDAAGRLFGRQYLHPAAREQAELIGLSNMPVQRNRIVLRQDVDLLDAGVETVADGNIHQPVTAGDGHRRLGALFRQWVEPRAGPAAQDECQCVCVRHGGLIQQKTVTGKDGAGGAGGMRPTQLATDQQPQ